MKVEIEIPPLPDGWVFDGVRCVKIGERVVSNGQWVEWMGLQPSAYLLVVAVEAEPQWEPSPELLAVLMPGWIARNASGDLYWHEERPEIHNFEWSSRFDVSFIDCIKSELLPPDSIPWDKSCFKIGDLQE